MAESTDRDVVVAAARRLYAGPGWARTRLTDVSEAAGTTSARILQEFPTTSDLFAAVYSQVHEEIAHAIAEGLDGDDPIELMRTGIRGWIDACRDRGTRRILVVDAPAALGWKRWREIGDTYGRALIDTLLADAMDKGRIPEQSVRPLSHVLAGALESGVEYAARQQDPDAALDEVECALNSLLDGLTRSGTHRA